METIEWTDNFSVGVAAMDAQHKTLIAMVNKLIRAPEATTQSATVSELLSAMRDYMLMHFLAEEELMTVHNYPQLEEQRAMHKTFSKKIIRFCIEWAHHNEALPGDMLTYLRSWLLYHILEEDKKYSAFFHERGVS
jgi:hemerythrin-like metal-binding protein